MNDLKLKIRLHRKLFFSGLGLLLALGFCHTRALAQIAPDYTNGAIAAIRLRLQPVADSLATQAQQAQTQRLEQEQIWAAAQLDSTLRKGQRDTLKNDLKRAQKAEKEQSDFLKKANETLALAAEISQSDSATQLKNLPKLEKKAAKFIPVERKIASPVPSATDLAATPPPAEPNDTTPAAAPIKVEKKIAVKVVGPAFAAYDPKQDVMLHPPQTPCTLVQNTRDEFSGQAQQQTAAAELFRYTAPALRKYLQGKIHIICRAAIAANGPSQSLLLTFTIQDPNARKAFGKLDKNAAATLQFIDGSTFIINNLRSDEGTFDPVGQVAVFQGQFPLESEILKKIRRSELDKIRIAWAAGYEDYDVQQVDALMQLMRCF